jgi:EF hand
VRKLANRPCWSTVFCGMILLSAGCSTARVASPPRLDAADAAKQALADYDQNKDGMLDAKELDRCPPLRSALKRMDKNNDNRLTAGEIQERLAAYLEGTPTPIPIPCEVLLDGRPLAGATVTFVPEKFLGSTFKRAWGTTDETGTAAVRMEGRDEGVFPGLYRAEVSKKNAQGQEMIPARFNTQSTLGEEVAGDTLGRGGQLTLRLTSK